MKRENFDKAKWGPIIIIGVILIAIYFAFGNLDIIGVEISRFLRIVSPLIYGILFTYFLYFPQKNIEKLFRKIKIKKFTLISDCARGISTVIVILLLIALVILVSTFLIPAVASSITDLVNNIPRYVQDIVDYFENLPDDSILAGLNISSMLSENAGNIVNSIINSQGIEQAARGVINFAGSVFNIIMGVFITVYILISRDKIGEYFTRLNNAAFKDKQRRDRVAKSFSQINKVLLTFIASKSVDCIINFTVATTVTTVFGVPYSPLLGLLAGLLNFIPYIGSIISTAIISTIALLTCPLPTAITVALCMLAFQQLDGNFIEPKIMKSSFKISPIIVIMAVVIGGAYFGLPGMFLGVPVAVIIDRILEEYMVSKEAVPDDDDIRR